MSNENVSKVVNWFLLDKNPVLIKFQADDITYQVSENVISKSDFQKYPIRKGDEVEVAIKGTEVSFLKKKNKFTKKSTGTTASPKASGTSATKTLTVEAVFNDTSIKFKEEKIDGKQWTKVSDELSAKGLMNIGVIAKNQITVTLENGIITAIELVASEKVEKVKEKEQKSSYSNKSYGRDEEATDKRTALMTAKDIVVALINNGLSEKEQIKTALNELTIDTYKALTNL